MSKFLRTAAEVVGVALSIAAAIPSGGTSLLGAALSLSAASAAAVAAAASAALTIGAQLLAKKTSGAGAPDSWRANPDQGIDLPLGDCYNSGGVLYRQTYGKNNKYETIVTCWGLGPVGGIHTTYVDGVVRTVTGTTVNITDRGKMYQATQLGLCPEPAQLLVPPIDPYGWTAQHKLSGKAAIMNTFVYDAKGSVTFTSIPNCGWRGYGKLGWDPRLDSTYPGGSGPQRADDESTWAWSRNPFIVALSFLIGWRQNGKLAGGAGTPLTGIIVEQLVEGANVADANSWYCGGVKSTSDNPWDVYTDILQAGGAEPLEAGARVGCLVNMPRVRLATFDRDWLANGSIVIPKVTNRRDRINAVTPTYLQESSVVTEDDDGNLITTVNWAQAPGPPIVVDEYVTADGRERRKPVSYPLVQCFAGDAPTQVAQLARYDIENAREISGISLPMKLRAYGYKPGDCVGLQLPEVGSSFADRDILLMQRSIEPSSCVVTMTARTETASKHAKALGQAASVATTPAIAANDTSSNDPATGAWNLVGGALDGTTASTPALIVTRVDAVEDDGLGAADAVIFEYRLAGGTAWVTAGQSSTSVEEFDITSVADGTSYYVAVSYKTGTLVGNRQVLGPVVTGVASSGGAAHLLRSQSLAYPLTSDDSSITVAAFTGIVDDGRTIAFPTATITGLGASTYYGVFWNSSASAYEVEVSPAGTRSAEAGYVFIGWQATSDSTGTYPVAPTPPGGYGGSGSSHEESV